MPITWKLCDNGYPVNHKRVERVIRENGLRAKTRRKFKAKTFSDQHCLYDAGEILRRKPCTRNWQSR